MPYITDHKQKFTDLNHHLAHQDQLRRKANGGNSILFSYPPEDELVYIQKAQEIYGDTVEFIDISRLLVQFIDEDDWSSFAEYYNDFANTPHLVFKSDDETPDLFDLIIDAIKATSSRGKIPFLIRSGCLYGTGIENVNIMEHGDVMGLKQPLVIFYPSTITDENLLFLNFKPASQYRCVLVN